MKSENIKVSDRCWFESRIVCSVADISPPVTVSLVRTGIVFAIHESVHNREVTVYSRSGCAH